MDSTSEIFELLATSPTEAEQRSLVLLRSTKSQEERDSINWARGQARIDRNIAMTAYQQSLKFFTDAEDEVSCKEIEERMFK